MSIFKKAIKKFISDKNNGDNNEEATTHVAVIQEPSSSTNDNEQTTENVPSSGDEKENNGKQGYVGEVDHDALNKILGEYDDDLQKSGAKNPTGAIEHLFKMNRMFELDPAAFLAAMFNHKKVDMDDFMSMIHEKGGYTKTIVEEGKEPEMEETNNGESDLSDEEKNHLNGVMEEFKDFDPSSKKDFEKLAPMMHMLVSHDSTKDHVKNLDDAYETAKWTHPDTRKELLDEMGKNKDIEKAKKSSSSLKPQGPTIEKEKKPKSRAEAMLKEAKKRGLM